MVTEPTNQSSVPLVRHDLSDLGSETLIRILPKEHTLTFKTWGVVNQVWFRRGVWFYASNVKISHRSFWCPNWKRIGEADLKLRARLLFELYDMTLILQIAIAICPAIWILNLTFAIKGKRNGWKTEKLCPHRQLRTLVRNLSNLLHVVTESTLVLSVGMSVIFDFL